MQGAHPAQGAGEDVPGIVEARSVCELQVGVGQVLALAHGEGLAPHQHDEEHHAQGEHVHGRRVGLALHHLGGHKARRAQGPCKPAPQLRVPRLSSLKCCPAAIDSSWQADHNRLPQILENWRI